MSHDHDDLLAAVRQLPREIEPERDLWPSLETQLQPRRPKRLYALTAAAALLFAIAGATWLAEPEPVPTVQVLAPAPEAEPDWQDEMDEATAALAARLEERRHELDPETLALVEQNLALIDAAIAETAEALEAHPDDQRLALALRDVLSRKVQLLETATRLPSPS